VNRLILAVWLSLAAAVQRLRGWSELILATWNIGPARHLPDALRDRVPAAVALQEAGDQWGNSGIIAKLRRIGYEFISGPERGQSSTPLAYDPTRLRLVRVKRYLLAEAQDAGPGAGPDHIKQKWAIGGLFEILDTGRFVWIFTDHWVASQQHRRRFLIALKMANRLALLSHRLRRPVFDLGDKNANPTSKALAPLRAVGWLMNHTVGRMVGTHGRRAIDQIWWEVRRWIRFLRHEVIETESDHDLVIAWFAIKPRRKVNR
jgi:hypothetical protein